MNNISPRDTFHTVDGSGAQEVWDVADPYRDGSVLIRQSRGEQEYDRLLEPTENGWRCVDDPNEFTGIVHVPSVPGGPKVGDYAARVHNGASLLYKAIASSDSGGSFTMEMVGATLGHPPYDNIYQDVNSVFRWKDGTEAEFVSGYGTDMAYAATRLATVRSSLRTKFFAATAAAQVLSAPNTMIGISDEYAEQLFLVETGLDAEDPAVQDRYEVFYDDLLNEFKAVKSA